MDDSDQILNTNIHDFTSSLDDPLISSVDYESNDAINSSTDEGSHHGENKFRPISYFKISTCRLEDSESRI